MRFQDKCLFPLDWTRITFDDVSFAIPARWEISSRRDVDLSVQFKNLKLNLPIIWANMSTVVDHNSAKYLSLMWWIWILHQNTTIEEQVNQVNKVKRFGTPIIENPYFVTENAKVYHVIEIFETNNIWAVIVVNNETDKIVKWIVTKRDILARESNDQNVVELMTDRTSLKFILSEDIHIDIIQNWDVLTKSRVEQLPIINKDWKLIWLFTRKWMEFYKDFKNSARDNKFRLVVGAAIWQNRNPLERATALINAWIDLLVIDTAHGWTTNFLNVIREVRSAFPDILIAAWNIDNWKAALEMARAWADILKVWIWPGWACKTREQTWFGTPQLSAIWNVKEALEESWLSHIWIIWDWGLSKPWNLAKALAAGADFGMIWSVLAWTDIAPWNLREINWRYYKDFRWMASSFEADIANRLSWKNYNDTYGPIFDEWANDIIAYKWDGSFIKTLRLFHGWLASSLSYCNSSNLREFYEKSRFQLQTMNGYMEWKPLTFVGN